MSPLSDQCDSKIVLGRLKLTRGREVDVQKRGNGIHGAMEFKLLCKVQPGDCSQRNAQHSKDCGTIGVVGTPLEFGVLIAVILDTGVSVWSEDINFKVV